MHRALRAGETEYGRRPMSRFQIGEKVFVGRAMTTRHCNSEAIVVAVEISRHSRPELTSLDKYTVRFSNGDHGEFYDIHLAAAQPAGHEVPSKGSTEPA